MEVAGLLRSLLVRLGLDRPAHRHKLRLLASSASLPVENDGAKESLQYLWDFFASFGTHSEPGDDGYRTPEDWKQSVVEGRPLLQSYEGPSPVATEPFIQLAQLLEGESRGFARSVGARTDSLDKALQAAAATLGAEWKPDDVGLSVANALSAASAALTWACTPSGNLAPVATSSSRAAEKLFGTASPHGLEGLRGLCLLRGMSDYAGRASLYGIKIPEGMASIRVHGFFRSIEGLFAAPWRNQAGALQVDGLTVERGRSHAECADGRTRRLFELVYCEACGELFVGGRRNTDDSVANTEMLTSTPNLEELPENSAATNFEALSYAQYAIFWPNEGEAKNGGRQ